MSTKNSKIFTKEQLEKMRKYGIPERTAYNRVWKGVDPEIACSIKNMHDNDWQNNIFALYKGEEILADGTIFEIAEKTGRSVKQLKYYTYPCYKKRCKNNRLTMEFLYNELEEEIL